jgi:endo-1,4-beta-mannosidase
MRWYVDQILGQGYDKEMFYTDPRVKQAYMDYVRLLVNRRNTLTGVPYKDDPTIFSCKDCTCRFKSKGGREPFVSVDAVEGGIVRQVSVTEKTSFTW